MSQPVLTIVIPTIAERHEWLAECLDSLMPLPPSRDVQIIVSGNGSGAPTRLVCATRGVTLVERPVRLTAADHGRVLLGMDLGKWVWFLPDDDISAPNSISTVLRYVREFDPDVVIGRTRRFVLADRSDLSVPVPRDRPLLISDDIRAVAEATQARIDLGAFVVRQGLMGVAMYDRYAGTSHEPFGALWDGLAATPNRRIVVTPDVLIYARQAAKAHDENAWQTWLGMLRVAELMPPEIRELAIQASGDVVSYRPVLRAIAEGEHPSPRNIPPSIWARVGRKRRAAYRVACHCPTYAARMALAVRQRFPSLSQARGASIAS